MKILKALILNLAILVNYKNVLLAQSTITNSGTEITISNSKVYISGSYVNGKSLRAKIANGGSIFIGKDLINNSYNHLFDTKSGKVFFRGSGEQRITGDSSIFFYALETDKTGGQIILDQSIVVQNALTLLRQNIFLNGYNIELNSSGFIIGESNKSRIYGSAGVIKLRRQIRETKLNENIAGVGIHISTRDNFGFVTIERGHSKQFFGGDSSVSRYYNYSAANLAKIDTLRLTYFEGEAVPNKAYYKVFAALNESEEWKNKGGIVDTTRSFVQSSAVSPPDLKSGKFTLFPTQNFATCAPNDPNYISSVFLVSTVATVGDSVKFVQLSPGIAESYSWNFGDGISSNEVSPYHNYNLTDTIRKKYNVTMTVTNGICSDTRKKEIEVIPKNRNQRSENLFYGIEVVDLYPNPNTGSVTLQVTASNVADIQIEIINSQGTISNLINERSSSFKRQLNLDYLAAGVYFIKFKVAEDIRVIKMVKM